MAYLASRSTISSFTSLFFWMRSLPVGPRDDGITDNPKYLGRSRYATPREACKWRNYIPDSIPYQLAKLRIKM